MLFLATKLIVRFNFSVVRRKVFKEPLFIGSVSERQMYIYYLRIDSSYALDFRLWLRRPKYDNKIPISELALVHGVARGDTIGLISKRHCGMC